MGSRWLIRRFRTGPQSEPRGHVSSPRSPVAGRSAGVLPPALRSGAEDSRAAERQRPSGRGPRARERRLQARLAQQPTPTVPTLRRVRQTSLPRHSSGRSTERPSGSSSSTTLSVPARPFRLARVPRPGHDQHRRPARNPPARPDQTRPLAPLRTLPRARCRGPTRTRPMPMTTERWVSPRLRVDRSADHFPLVRYVTVWYCRVALTNAERQARYRERRKAGESRIRYRRPADRRSRPQQWNDAVQTLLELQEQYRGVAGCLAGIACRVRDRGVARAGLRSGSVGTRGCRAAQGLRAVTASSWLLARRQTPCQQRTP